jgi:hypothetical protein
MEIIAVLSATWLAMGWRGYKFAEYWKHTWRNVAVLSLIYGLFALSSAAPADVVIVGLVPLIWFLITAIISFVLFGVGRTARVMVGRRHEFSPN